MFIRCLALTAVFASSACCYAVDPHADGDAGVPDAPPAIDAGPASLHVDIDGPGVVWVGDDSCAASCDLERSFGSNVTLTAQGRDVGGFVEWTGDCAGASGPVCELRLARAITVGARFRATRVVEISLTGAPARVLSTPPGLDCEAGTCAAPFAIDAEVHLTAMSRTGAPIAPAWVGCDALDAGGCVVRADGARRAVAVQAKSAAIMTVARTGTGGGTVTSTPTGIDCGTDCAESFSAGAPVTLVAAAAPGSQFVGWSIASCGHAPTCTVAAGQAAMVTASFARLTTLTVHVAGEGSLEAPGAGLSCDGTCSTTIADTVAPRLVPVAAPGWRFSGWSGGCSGHGLCMPTMTSDQSVSATFERAVLWGDDYGGAGRQEIVAVASDLLGNLFVAGNFTGTIAFGPFELHSQGGGDIFLARLDGDGRPVWAMSFGGHDAEAVHDMALTYGGGVVLTGYLSGSDPVSFGGAPLHAVGGADVFVAAFAPDGEPQWSRSLGDADTQVGLAVAVDSQGAVYVGGTFGGTVDFGDRSWTALGQDGFLWALDPDGSPVWSRRIGGLGQDAVRKLAVGLLDDNVYLTGSFERRIDLGDGPLVSRGGSDVMVAGYLNDGELAWSHSYGTADDAELGYGIGVDIMGRLVVLAGTAGSLDLGRGPIGPEGSRVAALIGLTFEGKLRWSHAYVPTLTAMAVDRLGSVVVTGKSVPGRMPTDFGPGPLVVDGDGDVVVARFNADGAPLWSADLGDDSPRDQIGLAVAVTITGRVAVGGRFGGAIDLGDGVLHAQDDDALLVLFEH